MKTFLHFFQTFFQSLNKYLINLLKYDTYVKWQKHPLVQHLYLDLNQEEKDLVFTQRKRMRLIKEVRTTTRNTEVKVVNAKP